MWWHWLVAGLGIASGVVVSARNVHLYLVRPFVRAIRNLHTIVEHLTTITEDVRQLSEDLKVLLQTVLNHETRIRDLEDGKSRRERLGVEEP